MTAKEFEGLGLPLQAPSQMLVESGLEWLRDNTTLEFDIMDMESVKALPSSARLFLVKFSEICSRDTGVTGESIGPMSQDFTTDSVERQTMSLARQLLKAYLKPGVKFIPCKRRWR